MGKSDASLMTIEDDWEEALWLARGDYDSSEEFFGALITNLQYEMSSKQI